MPIPNIPREMVASKACDALDSEENKENEDIRRGKQAVLNSKNRHDYPSGKGGCLINGILECENADGTLFQVRVSRSRVVKAPTRYSPCESSQQSKDTQENTHEKTAQTSVQVDESITEKVMDEKEDVQIAIDHTTIENRKSPEMLAGRTSQQESSKFHSTGKSWIRENVDIDAFIDATIRHYNKTANEIQLSKNDVKKLSHGKVLEMKPRKGVCLRFSVKRCVLEVRGQFKEWMEHDFPGINCELKEIEKQKRLKICSSMNLTEINTDATVVLQRCNATSTITQNSISTCENDADCAGSRQLNVRDSGAVPDVEVCSMDSNGTGDVQESMPKNTSSSAAHITPKHTITTVISETSKRNRLSLKGSRRLKTTLISTKCETASNAEDAGTKDKSSTSLDITAYMKKVSPSQKQEATGDEKPGPAISGLRNQGNTCFLNSVLQVLRYTPQFCTHMASLAGSAKCTKKERIMYNQLMDMDQDEDTSSSANESLALELMINMHEMFSKMSHRETMYRKGKAQHATIRPYHVLDNITGLNPMFEGYLQHDVHELLHCLLCYIQDAVQEVNRFREMPKRTEPRIRDFKDVLKNCHSPVKRSLREELGVVDNTPDGYVECKKRKHSNEIASVVTKKQKIPTTSCESNGSTVKDTISNPFNTNAGSMIKAAGKHRKRASVNNDAKTIDHKLSPPESISDTKKASQDNYCVANNRSLCAVVRMERCEQADQMSPKKCSPTLADLHFTNTTVEDCVQAVFQGKMALRTRCCECETTKERLEMFQDIALPINKACKGLLTTDEDDSNMNNSDAHARISEVSWLQNAVAQTERLTGDNKYFCDQCYTHTEAELSQHYLEMPNILTLQLKRFACDNRSSFDSVKKINDHVLVPKILPCLRDDCMNDCHLENHQYELYGLISHTGISLSSGHYVAYVRVPADHPSLSTTQPATSKATSHSVNENNTKEPSTQNPTCSTRLTPDTRTTRGCSSTDTGNHENSDNPNDDLADPNNNQDNNNNITPPTAPPPTCESTNVTTPATTPRSSSRRTSLASSSSTDSAKRSNKQKQQKHQGMLDNDVSWLECDDEYITGLTDAEFDELLSPKGLCTPYLLFYTKKQHIVS